MKQNKLVMRMKDWNEKSMFCAVAIILFAITAVVVAADPAGPTSTTVVTTSSRNVSQLPAASVDARGGNVTELNIAALTITKSWQGYYGNITGQIALQNGNNQTFYNWSMTNFQGRVFASRSNSIGWTTINCTNSTNRTSEESYLGQSSSDGDSVTNTFNGTTHPAFPVGSVNISSNTCYATNGFVNNNSQSQNFTMLLLSPSNGQVVYTALMNRSVLGFDGQYHDFELLVGENERTQVGITTYFFWTEFS